MPLPDASFLDKALPPGIIVFSTEEALVRITPEELEVHRIVVSKTYDSDALDFRGSGFLQRGPVQVDAVAELLGIEIRLRGHVGGQLEAACDRCLGSVKLRVDRDFDLLYRPAKTVPNEEEIEIPPGELNVGFYTGGGIELADVVAEQVILSVPMKVVCRADCQGLCPLCGANRNLETCGCSNPQAESPFAKLSED